MKHFYSLLICISFLLFNQNSSAQCFPDASFASESVGLYPSGAMQMDCSGLSASKTFVCLTDTIAYDIIVGSPDTIELYIGATRIMEVAGLPPGITMTTDVINTATAAAPYGTWLNTGGLQDLTPAIGCVSFVGNQADWDAASTGGPNSDGIYPIAISYDTRLDSSYLSIDAIIPDGSWLGNAPIPNFGGLLTLEVELRVNESGCGGSNLFVSPQVTADDEGTTACDGKATIEVHNGTPPYTFAFSTGETNQTAVGLCPGIYSVDVVDAVGTQGTTDFAVASSANVYSNVPATNTGGIDTLYGTVYTCDLDYNLPIDSFHIANAVVLFNSDTILASWIVWQLGMPFTVTTHHPYTSMDPTVFSASLWCLNGRAEAGVFQLFDLHGILVGMNETTNPDFDVLLRPNPNNGLFEVQLNMPRPIGIRIMDVSGKVVHSKQFVGSTVYPLNIQAVRSGMYIIELNTEEGRIFKRVIKN